MLISIRLILGAVRAVRAVRAVNPVHAVVYAHAMGDP